MVPVALSDVIAVGEVPTAEQIAILAGAGFRSLLNTQPDGEVERLMSSAEVAALAAKAGLTYRHVPIVSRRPPGTSVDAFDEALRALPRPIYACCYSGARTAAAWALAAARHEDPAKVVEACTKAGYDMSFMKPYLDARHADAKAAAKTAPPAPVASPAAAPATTAVSAADPLKSNGSAARPGNGDDKPASPAAASPTAAVAPPSAALASSVPELVPSVLPRAASAGGFAVSG